MKLDNSEKKNRDIIKIIGYVFWGVGLVTVLLAFIYIVVNEKNRDSFRDTWGIFMGGGVVSAFIGKVIIESRSKS